MAEKMKAMVLSKLAPIETRPLKLASIDRPAIKSKNDLLLEIEEDFDISVPLNVLADIRTLRDLARAITRLVEMG